MDKVLAELDVETIVEKDDQGGALEITVLP